MHPLKLSSHGTRVYLRTNVFNDYTDYDYIRSYFHDMVREFPILMHKHDFYEINIITEGDGYHYIEDQCFEAKKGDVFVIPPNINHGYYTEVPDKFKIFHLLILPEFINEYHNELHMMNGYTVLFEIEPNLRKEVSKQFFLSLTVDEMNELEPIFSSLVSTNNDIPNNKVIRISYALYLISKLSTFIGKSHEKIMNDVKNNRNALSTFIIKTMDYMNENYMEKITIDDLSKMANMSRATYLRHFHALNKKTPNDYLTEIRIREACKLLKETNYSIYLISEKCGFFDPSHFSKTFKKYKNVKPLAYRKNINLN